MSEESLAPLESNLELTEDVIQGFRDRLQRANIKLSFSYGDWSGFARTLEDAPNSSVYDLVLTAETIYRLDSVPSLIQVLKYAPRDAGRDSLETTVPRDVTTALDNLTLQRPWDSQDVVILVAAKVGGTVLREKGDADLVEFIDTLLWSRRRNAGLYL